MSLDPELEMKRALLWDLRQRMADPGSGLDAHQQAETLADPELAPILFSYVEKCGDDSARSTLYWMLGHLGRNTGLQSVENFLISKGATEPGSTSKSLLVDALVRQPGTARRDDVLSILHSYLKVRHLSLRLHVLWGLAKLRDGRSVPFVVDHLVKARGADEQGNCLKALLACGDSTLIEQVKPYASSPRYEVCEPAMTCLGEWMGTEATPLLLELVKGPRHRRQCAINALCDYGDERAMLIISKHFKKWFKEPYPFSGRYEGLTGEIQYFSRYPNHKGAAEQLSIVRERWDLFAPRIQEWLIANVPLFSSMPLTGTGGL